MRIGVALERIEGALIPLLRQRRIKSALPIDPGQLLELAFRILGELLFLARDLGFLSVAL